MNRCYTTEIIRAGTVITLLFLLILPIYSNTFNASWHFDDRPNIVNNYHLHLKDLRPKSLLQTFFTKPGNPLETGDKMYRPVACLTFALNWYFGGDDVTGYHAVNIVIHILTAFFLYLTIFNLFKSPNLEDKFKGNEHFIALLSAALWAVNPIQTQAVTYIVQRMAIMAAMFYILGINFYIKGRLADVRFKKILFYTGCLLSFLFALGSKENAILLPLSLILVEIVFFQKSAGLGKKNKIMWATLASIVFMLFLFGGMLFLMKKDPLNYFNQLYLIRPFSISERLLTEPRIVLYYLTQIFYPISYRLSIEHDIILSTSLLKPWTTLPAILIIFCLVGIGLSQIRKRPLIAFGILFFFLNHIVESTILPLELVFEHRNYLPSLFLFFPVSVGIKWLIDYYREKQFSMYIIIVSFITLLIIGFGTSTYIRNMAWATEKSLWEDAMHKAPGRARSVYNVAKYSYFQAGHFDKAMEYYEKAFMLKASKPEYFKALILNGMASIYFLKNENEKAIKFYKRALDYFPEFATIRNNLIRAFIKGGRWDEASENVDFILEKENSSKKFLYLKGFVLLKQQKGEKALYFLQKALVLAPTDKKFLLTMGAAMDSTGNYKDGRRFLDRATRIVPDDIMVLFCLIENRLRAQDPSGVKQYMEKMFYSFSILQIKKQLQRLPRDNFAVPVSRELLAAAIGSELRERAESIIEPGFLQK